jgi:thiol:disulfide interchange protein DsbD
MKLRILSYVLLLAACFGASASAQTSASVVKVKPEDSVYKIKAGAATKIDVEVKIDDGYHINSNRPAEQFLIPTALKLERLPGLTTTRVLYPKAKMQKFGFSEKPLSVYEGKARLSFTARALPSLAAGSYTLKGKLTVQACNNQACLRPQTVNVAIPLEVTK